MEDNIELDYLNQPEGAEGGEDETVIDDNIMIAGIPFVLAGQLKTNTPHYIHFF